MNSRTHQEYEPDSILDDRPFSIAASKAADLAAVAVQEYANRLSLRGLGELEHENIPAEQGIESEERVLRLSTLLPSTHTSTFDKELGTHDSFGPDVMVHWYY